MEKTKDAKVKESPIQRTNKKRWIPDIERKNTTDGRFWKASSCTPGHDSPAKELNYCDKGRKVEISQKNARTEKRN